MRLLDRLRRRKPPEEERPDDAFQRRAKSLI
jgi:hypothetical protein